MKTVAFLGDSHFSERSRFAECKRVHSWILDDVQSRGVDMIGHTGDLYDAESTPIERLAVFALASGAAEIAPSVFIRGNHDAFRDLRVLAKIKARHGIIVEEAAGFHEVAGIGVVALAWPRKAELLARLGATTVGQGREGAAEALRALYSGLAVQVERFRGPTMALAHAQVRDAVTSTGQPLVGCDLEVGLDDLRRLGVDLYALGHIHKSQNWSIDGAPVIYPGSPYRTAHGENEAKGYTIARWDDAGNVSHEFIETPATGMVDLEAAWNDGVLVGLETVGFLGSEVRLRYRVPRDFRDAAAEQVHAWKTAIEHKLAGLKVEEVVIAETRARTPEVALATTVGAKLEALWNAKGFDPADRREALLEKASNLEVRRAS